MTWVSVARNVEGWERLASFEHPKKVKSPLESVRTFLYPARVGKAVCVSCCSFVSQVAREIGGANFGAGITWRGNVGRLGVPRNFLHTQSFQKRA